MAVPVTPPAWVETWTAPHAVAFAARLAGATGAAELDFSGTVVDPDGARAWLDTVGADTRLPLGAELAAGCGLDRCWLDVRAPADRLETTLREVGAALRRTPRPRTPVESRSAVDRTAARLLHLPAASRWPSGAAGFAVADAPADAVGAALVDALPYRPAVHAPTPLSASLTRLDTVPDQLTVVVDPEGGALARRAVALALTVALREQAGLTYQVDELSRTVRFRVAPEDAEVAFDAARAATGALPWDAAARSLALDLATCATTAPGQVYVLATNWADTGHLGWPTPPSAPSAPDLAWIVPGP